MKYLALCLLALVTLLTTPVVAQDLESRGLFLASTGPRSEYARTFWWEMDRPQLRRLVDSVAAAGINELYPSAYGHGNYFFHTDHAIFPKGVITKKRDIDPLAVLIEEAHAQDIKVIPFFPFLVAGGAPYVIQSAGGTLPHPDWFGVDNQERPGKTLSFDPAHPEVRAYLQQLVIDLLAYDIDGLMLDYIRYLGSHMGYTPTARTAFEAKQGADPLELYRQPEKWSTNVVYCLEPDSWAGKDWYLSSLLTTLNRIGAPFKIVPEAEGLFDVVPANGTVLIACYYDLPEDLIKKLHHFVSDGGNVIFLDAPTTAMKSHADTLGPILGMKARSRYAAPQTRDLRVENVHPVTEGVEGGAVTGSANALAEPLEDTTVLARFSDEAPALLLNFLGEGRSLLFNFDLLLNYDGDAGIALLDTSVDWFLSERAAEPGAQELIALNAAWTQFRCDQVTEVVALVRETLQAHRPGLLLGAATTPREFHVNHVFQEWKTWIARDYIDVVYPMDYFGSTEALSSALAWQTEGVDKSRIVPLLALYRRDGGKTVPVTTDTLQSQLDRVSGQGFAGVGLFSNQRLSPELDELLKSRWATDAK